MIGQFQLKKDRRLSLKSRHENDNDHNNDPQSHLVGEVDSLDRMRPGSFATYETQRPVRVSRNII